MTRIQIAAALVVIMTQIELAHADVPFTGVASVAVGYTHSCALTSAGGVKCWGNNSSGELGNGTANSAPTATDAFGLSSGVAAIAAGGAFGSSHSCALTSAGAVKCWGSALPNGTGSQVFVPTQVPGLTSGVVAIAAGGWHSCAQISGGSVKCWGLNDAGQIGDGTLNNAHVPTNVTGLTGVIAIAAGGFHTCALTGGGGVKCWGENFYGQVGNGARSNVLTPVDVVGLATGVVGIEAGSFHTCALMSGGAVKCWGDNSSGQLGDGTTNAFATTPVDVTGLAGAAAIAAGGGLTCALTGGGGAKCWGWGVPNAVGVPGLAGGVTSIAVGGNACVVKAGAALCWGGNNQGQLGNGTFNFEPRAVGVVGLFPGATAITAGGYHSCGLTPDGAAKCWGSNGGNQLGNGTAIGAVTPTDVTGLSSGVTAISGGDSHTCALTSAGGAKCWGFNLVGEIGNGTTTPAPTPVDVTGLTAGTAAIEAAGLHTCALTTGGGVKCWGANGSGELGNGTLTDSPTPVDVSGLGSGVVAIGAGQARGCAITGAGGLKCWGRNEYGQLGDGTTTDSPVPVDVFGLTTGVTAVAAGGYHSCALTSGGGVKCWGSNGIGQLGDGTTTDSLTAVDVTGLTVGVRAIAAGDNHSCALTLAGGVKCWGWNAYGQIGMGVIADALVPTDVVGLGTGVVAIAAGGTHTCALLSGGVVNCWGLNDDGRLGNGKAGLVSLPEAVVVGACVDLFDVDRASSFCPNVEWMRNRLVTQGCQPGEYCPNNSVIRLAMAAFMNRLGTALTQAVIKTEQAVGALDPGAAPVVCKTADVAASAFPRRVHLDAVFRGLSSSDVGVAVEVVASIDSGATWQRVAIFDNHVHLKSTRWANVRALGGIDVAANGTPRFGVRVSRGGFPAAGVLTDASCHLRARIESRTATAGPY